MVGVLAGAIVVYIGHEYWTFAQEDPGVSRQRFTKFCLTVAGVLVARGLIVGAMERLFGEAIPMLVILTLAVGVTFVLNYVVSRLWVFR